MFRAYRQRRALFKVSSWRLFGMGLDPAGNLICRWRAGHTGPCGWLAVLPVHGAVAPVPMHWRAAAKRRELAAKIAMQDVVPGMGGAAARGGTAEEQMHAVNHGAAGDASGASEGDVAGSPAASSSSASEKRVPYPEDISAYDRRLRLSNVGTYLWRLCYLAAYAGAAFVFCCQYLRLKGAGSKYFRKILNEFEQAVYDASPWWLQDLFSAVGECETLVAWAATLGYDAELYTRELVHEAEKLKREEEWLLQQLATKRRWRLLSIFAGFLTFVCGVCFWGA